MYYIYHDPVVFKVSGKDSTRYLNARLTNDIKNQSIASHCLACALNQQGKVQGFFSVLRLNSEEYLLVSAKGNVVELLGVVKQFIVADRVTVEEHSSKFILLHLLTNDSSQKGVDSHPWGWSYCVNRFGKQGLEYLVHKEYLTSVLREIGVTKEQELSEQQALLERIRYGKVAFPDEINDSILFSELDLKEAISFTKGCYVGQEVVEKSVALGRTPRKVVRVVFSGDISFNQETELFDRVPGKQIGKILSYAYDQTIDQTWSFAVIRNDPVLFQDGVWYGEQAGKILLTDEYSEDG